MPKTHHRSNVQVMPKHDELTQPQQKNLRLRNTWTTKPMIKALYRKLKNLTGGHAFPTIWKY